MKVLRHGTGWLRIAVLAFAMLVALVGASAAAAGTLRRVPLDFPTIQAAIDAAVDGDTVLVSPGTYFERIDFRLKEITVESVAGRDATVIDGNRAGVVVTIAADPGETPILRGFTIRNGGDHNFTDGGVDTSGGPALIEKNKIVANGFCDAGAVEAARSAATIRDNIISGNSQTSCIGGIGGGGIGLRGVGTLNIRDNVISANSHGSRGGGIALFQAGTPTISGNVITDNSGDDWGGGISMLNFSDALIVNNLIVGNRAFQGGGIYWTVPSDDEGPRVVNNTITGNDATLGLAVFGNGFHATARLANNILGGSGWGSRGRVRWG